MKVLTVYAHPNPKSFCHAILQQFIKGLRMRVGVVLDRGGRSDQTCRLPA